MHASDTDKAAMKQAFTRINTALRSAEMAEDAGEIKRRLFTLSIAVIDAEALARAIEDHTRSRAIAAQAEDVDTELAARQLEQV